MSLKSSSIALSKLDPQGETNFWEFYRKNTRVVEDIFSAQVWRLASYLPSYEMDDLHQDVLCRLNRCNILSRFDPEKASFNTYFTGTIRGYIMNWLSLRNNPNPSWRSSCGDSLSYKRVFYKTLNGGCHEDAGVSEDIPSKECLEETYALHEMIGLIRKSLPEKYWKLFDLFYAGLNKQDIAKSLNISATAVSAMASKLSACGSKILERSR
jgi:RNA polymerase sigma factor (sigma-70 family)